MTNIPSDATAAKIRNHLVKEFNGQIVRSISFLSNPYEAWQSLDLRVKQIAKLRKALVAQGWVLDQSNLMEEARDRVFPYRKGINLIKVGLDGFVRVYGQKKAKRTNIPYYD